MIVALVQLLLAATRLRRKLKIVPLIVITLVGLWEVFMVWNLYSYADGVELSVYTWEPFYSQIVTIVIAMELTSFGLFFVYYKGIHLSIQSDIRQTFLGLVVGLVYMICLFMLTFLVSIDENYYYVILAVFAMLPLFFALKYKGLWVFYMMVFLTFSATFFIYNGYMTIYLYLSGM